MFPPVRKGKTKFRNNSYLNDRRLRRAAESLHFPQIALELFDGTRCRV